MRCSLRLEDQQAQEEFTDYLRHQTQQRTKIFNPSLGVACFLSILGVYQSKSEDAKRIFVQNLILLGPGVIFSSIPLCLSYKRLVWAELILPTHLIMLTLMLYLIDSGYFFDEVTEAMRQWQVILYSIF